MPSQHPEEVGYGHVVESYVTRTYGGLPRHLVLNGARFLGPRWWHTTRFTRHLIADAAAIDDEELEALLGYEWRSRLTAGWLIGVNRREQFRARIGDLLSGSRAWGASATPATPPPNSAAGRTSSASSPTAGPGRSSRLTAAT